jgi:hypothetical protein
MEISTARLHGQACLVCGTTSDDLLPMDRRLLAIGSDGIFRTGSTAVCPSHMVARPHLSRLATWDHDDERPYRNAPDRTGDAQIYPHQISRVARQAE